jgi:hypothetical protein
MVTAWTAWFLAFAIFVSIKNVNWHMKHDNHEGVVKWMTLTLLFIFALLISVFA